MKKWLTTLLVVAVTSVLLGYALWNVDLVALGDALAGADYRFVAPFLFTLTVFFWTLRNRRLAQRLELARRRPAGALLNRVTACPT